MLVSSITLLARQAYADGQILRSTARYRVYALPPGWLDHFVLVVPNEERESLPEFSPSLVIPVTVDSRRGCLIVREAVLAADEMPETPHVELHGVA